MVRGIFSITVAAVWTGLLQIPVTLTALVTRSGDISLWMARNLWAPVVLWSAGAKVELDPLPQLDPRQPYIFMSNHQGNFDIPVATRVIPHNVYFVAKKSLRWMPILGWYLIVVGHILIDRSRRADAMRSLEAAGKKIAGGKSIIIYPEGTRSRDGAIHPFKKGPFMLALAAQVPIVPVVIEGSQKLMTKGGIRMQPGVIRVRLAEPIPTAGLTAADRDLLMRRVHDRMIETHLAIGGIGGDREKAIAEAEADSRVTAAVSSGTAA